jgi:hypothetical protein
MTPPILDFFRWFIASMLWVGLMAHVLAFANSVLVGRADMAKGASAVARIQTSLVSGCRIEFKLLLASPKF